MSMDAPPQVFPHDGKYKFKKGRGKDKNGKARNPEYWYVTYTEGPGDKQWMEEKDRNYPARINGKGEASTPKPVERKNTPPEIRRMRQEMEQLKIDKAEAERQRKKAEKAKDAAEKKLSEVSNPSDPGSSEGEPSEPVHLQSFSIKAKDLVRLQQLGKGGFGNVFFGKWNYMDVAIKELHAVNISEQAINSFKTEAVLMRQLTCPRVSTVYGFCETPPYRIVMEYAAEGSLEKLLHNTAKTIPWPERYRIAYDVTLGVSHLHKHDVLHRDIKSSNVLMFPNSRAKLCDFGLSKIHKDIAKKTMSGAGTLAWKAPELFEKKASSKASDIYSLGMLFWEIATRKSPSDEGEHPAMVFMLVQFGKLDFPKDCPTEYKELVKQCWKKEPSERPTADYLIASLSKLWADVSESLEKPESNFLESENPAMEETLSFGASV